VFGLGFDTATEVALLASRDGNDASDPSEPDIGSAAPMIA
jgi:hypothetical protein